MKLLEYHNPKEKYHEKINNADLEREQVIVAIIPRMLHCEICNSPKKFVWEDMKILNGDGRPIRICSSCLAMYRRFEKYSDEEMKAILNA